jgi:signal transduction histidine kinase
MRYGLLELQKNANQCYVVLENLLEWVKKDTNRLQYQPEQIFLLSLIHDTLDLFQIQSHEKNIIWSISVPEDVLVFVDERMMSTVLRNLFSNALKFSNPSGEVIVQCNQYSDYLQLTVEDHGIGMSDEKLNSIKSGMNIMSDFGTTGERGTGIGLLVSLDLLKILKANVLIDSQLGKGTKIMIQLPKISN